MLSSLASALMALIHLVEYTRDLKKARQFLLPTVVPAKIQQLFKETDEKKLTCSLSLHLNNLLRWNGVDAHFTDQETEAGLGRWLP